ncbi:MAG: pantetheine-phosphate adenylyltransferase [Candidatus Thorarchaeota archaeon]
MRPYGVVVFAGTFDRLHEGHKHILRTALRLGERVRIGVTTDKMLSRKSRRAEIQTYEERENGVMEFLRSEGATERCELFPIDTVEGGADVMSDIDALLVSDEPGVVQNALRINEMRLKNGLKRFHVVIVPRVLTSDGRPLSSTRERLGDNTTGELIY